MAFGFGLSNIAFRKRMSWTNVMVAVVVGILGGYYTFKPGLDQAKAAIERREAIKEIQERRRIELEKGSMLFD